MIAAIDLKSNGITDVSFSVHHFLPHCAGRKKFKKTVEGERDCSAQFPITQEQRRSDGYACVRSILETAWWCEEVTSKSNRLLTNRSEVYHSGRAETLRNPLEINTSLALVALVALAETHLVNI